MSKLNMYQLLFVAVLLLKLSGVTPFEGWTWWAVFSPLVIGSLAGYINSILKIIDFRGTFRDVVLQIHAEGTYKRAVRREVRRQEKETAQRIKSGL